MAKLAAIGSGRQRRLLAWEKLFHKLILVLPPKLPPLTAVRDRGRMKPLFQEKT